MNSPTLKIFALAALSAACALPASAATSDIVGYNTITCLANSDTIVGVPLRQSGSVKGALNGAPSFDVPSDTATLTLSAAPSDTPEALAFSHYLQFTSGTKNGQYFTIGANSGTSVSIDLNGGNLSGVVSSGETADTFIIAKYWTLNDLFPPAEATTAWDVDGKPNGHAIVASTNGFFSGRTTELITPDLSTAGTNLAPASTYFIFNGAWRKQGQVLTSNFGPTLLAPDTYFIIRHTTGVANATIYTSVGEVTMNAIEIPLSTNSSQGNNLKQDNFIAIPRPIDVTLAQLGLVSSGAFVASTNGFFSGRKDELLVFNNSSAGFNKAAATTYFYFNNAWRKQGAALTDPFDTAVIKAGEGFIIRKTPTSDGSPALWLNDADY